MIPSLNRSPPNPVACPSLTFLVPHLRPFIFMLRDPNRNIFTAPLDVYIVGGYLGEPLADELSHTLLATLHKSRYAFRLVLACIAGLNSKWLRSENGATTNNDKDNDNNSMNNWNSVNPTATTTTTSTSTTTQSAESHSTTPSSKPLSSIVDACCDTAMSSNSHGAAEGGDGWLPRRTSLAVDVASGRAFPVRFEGAGRGPGFKVRHARIFAGDREHALAQVKKKERERERAACASDAGFFSFLMSCPERLAETICRERVKLRMFDRKKRVVLWWSVRGGMAQLHHRCIRKRT